MTDTQTLQDIENEMLAFWQKDKTFEKSVSERSEDNLYVFYDGPPFISGLPHYGHLLGSIAKDVIPRYWTMKGKKVERVWGWDAHGLTVENKVQKQLGIKNRRDIEAYGLEKFTQACYKYTSDVSEEWEWYISKIGRWVDMKNAYKTIDQSYMESVMWVFKTLYDRGLIYEGVRTSLYCTTCGTPVSNFEVAMDNTYKDVEDPSVTIKFKVTSAGKFKGVNMLAWTTTPWTLPSNRALVVDADASYALVECNHELYIVANALIAKVFAQAEFTKKEEFMGKELLGLEYEPLYKFYTPNKNDFKVYAYAGMVTMDEGTGVVHSAPGFGEIDTQMGSDAGLSIMLTLDDEGKFLPGDWEVKNPFTSMYYADANPHIRKDLTDRGCMFKDEKIVHRFPYHDRCETLLIQKAQNSWFLRETALKERMYALNEDINWIPKRLKHGRFKKGIDSAPDWCISRNRFWATPMPVWEAEDGTRVVIGSIAELEQLSGKKVSDLHRPYIDAITFEQDGKVFTRRKEVLDSWFEAGSMPYAQIHYPFENKEKFEKNFPGDFIVEYIAQTRAWFRVMHVLSTALFDTSSFKNVIATGVMAGDDGRKMSKTYGNYTDPREVLETIGGDALRLYLMNSPLMLGGNANFDLVELQTKLRNVLNPLWNACRFYIMYAGNKAPGKATTENALDLWILTRLEEVKKTVSESIERYEVPPAVQAIEVFVDDLSRWYVRRSRERISAGEPDALFTMHTVLVDFAKTAAPIIPFVTEKIYQELVGDKSVHLCEFPKVDEDFIAANQELLTKMASTRAVVSSALAVREAEKIKIRQPLGTLYVVAEDQRFNSVYWELISEEVNVKECVFNTPPTANLPTLTEAGFTVYLDTQITPELQLEGEAREIIRTLQGLRKKHALKVADKITATYPNQELTVKAVNAFGAEIMARINATTLTLGTEFAIEQVD